MASFSVVDDDQLMLVTNMGQVIRIRVYGGDGDSIRIASRKTQGVRLFNVADDKNEKVVSAGLVREADEDDEATRGEGGSFDSKGDAKAMTTPDMSADDADVEILSKANPYEDTPT